MLKRISLLITLLSASHALAQTAPERSAVTSLLASPGVCVIGDEQQVCEMNLSLLWETPVAGNYCIWIADQPEPLKCWQDSWTGVYSMTFRSAGQVEFIMTTSTNEVVSRVEVRVIGELEQRIRARRRSGFWRVF